jgi:quercetin 2,3-dioxygenase
VVRGALTVNGQALGAGDAAQLQHEWGLDLAGGERAEVLVFDLHA